MGKSDRDQSSDEEIAAKPDIKAKKGKKRTSEGAPSPSSKKAKVASGIKESDEGEPYIELSETRRVSVRSFRKKTYVDLREFFNDKETGKPRPGAKGLSLPLEQWAILKENIALVDEMIARVDK